MTLLATSTTIASEHPLRGQYLHRTKHETMLDTPSSTLHIVPGNSRLPYYLYLPAHIDPSTRVLVTVHGISRNAKEHVEMFAAFARDTGRIVVAPLFSEQDYRRYQRLGADKCRADRALLDVLQDVSNISNVSTDMVDLFGFSAGAQFAHRFAMLHAHRVSTLAVASAGWFTLLNSNERFPYAISPETRKGRMASASLDRFLSIPMLVMVGEYDVVRDQGLRQERRVDRAQGYTRMERAARWVQSLRAEAHGRNVDINIEFRVLARCGHSFAQCVHRGGLVERVVELLKQ